MIYTDCTVTVSGERSAINKPIILYRGDKEVEIRFYVMQSPFYQKLLLTKATNLVSDIDASYGQLVIRIPDKLPIFSDVTPVESDGAIVFTVTGEMIDEIDEVGNYDFQIRLFDEEKISRATIPPVIEGVKIKEPIAIEDDSTTNEVNLATINNAVSTALINYI